MIRHEKAIGNSNMVRLELLKPKWVASDEMNRALNSETRSLIKPVIVVNETNSDWYSKQFPLLIQSHRYFSKNSFEPEKDPPDLDEVHAAFVLDPNVMWDEHKFCL